MRIKLDENLPARLEIELAEFGHDVDTVPSERLSGAVDSRVWRAAQAGSRFFITQDLDFSDVRTFKPGEHAGLLLLRLRVPARQAVRHRLLQLFRTEATETWAGCFVIATDSKLRIRRA
jgi:predicted nuclease of predicted toxin-antitoxin system